MQTGSETARSEQVAGSPATARLYRSRDQKIVAGVCAGLGEYFAIDPVWFRIGFVVLTFGGGSGLLVYLLMWLIVPESPEGYTAPGGGRGQAFNGVTVVGVVFMFVGTIALVNTIAPWLGQYFWPIIFVVGGLALVLGGIDNDRR